MLSTYILRWGWGLVMLLSTLLVVGVADQHGGKGFEGTQSSSSQAATSNAGAILHTLSTLQTSKGGFGKPPSLLATRRALFLAQLYGLLDKIDTKKAAEFISHATEGDQWLGWREGGSKSGGHLKNMVSIHSAVFSCRHLSIDIKNASAIADLVASGWDEQEGLFMMSPGTPGDIMSSALALTVAEQTGKLHAFQSHAARIRARLEDLLNQVGEDGMFAANHRDCPGLEHVVCNYYFVLLAGLAGVSLEGVTAAIVSNITSLQNLDRSPRWHGGFYTDSTRTKVTLTSSLHAVATLHILSLASRSGQSFVSRLDAQALGAYLAGAPSDMESAYMAHRALAYTPIITNYFETKVTYELRGSGWGGGEEGGGGRGDVVQGTVMKPLLSVTTFGGLPHSGLDIRLEATQQQGSQWINVFATEQVSLSWDPIKSVYSSPDFIDTAGKLGELKLNFTALCVVRGLGEIYFDVGDAKKIGYGMRIKPVATYKGEQVEIGGGVGVGADFLFTVELFTRTAGETVGAGEGTDEAGDGERAAAQVEEDKTGGHARAEVPMTQGDFILKFLALDPSHHSIGGSSINGTIPRTIPHKSLQGVRQGTRVTTNSLPENSEPLPLANGAAATAPDGSDTAGREEDEEQRTSPSQEDAQTAVSEQGEGGLLKFAFSLSPEYPLPAGRLYFIFQVQQASTGIVHTLRRSVWYTLNVRMVATDVSVSRRIDGGAVAPVQAGLVNLADTVLLEMTPGVIGDDGVIAPLDHRWLARHQFIMEMLTPTGKKLGIVHGHVAEGKEGRRLVFERKIGRTLRSLGVTLVNFLFVPPASAGPSVRLLVTNELKPNLDELALSNGQSRGGYSGGGLNLTVSSTLRVEKLQAPPPNALLEFGSTLTLTFTIVDVLSKVELGGSVGGRGRVFMAVYPIDGHHHHRRTDSNPTEGHYHGAASVFQQDSVPLEGDQMGQVVTWHIDANAAQGAFVLGLSVADEDGGITDLVSSEDGKPWRHRIRIGGPVTGEVISKFAAPTAALWSPGTTQHVALSPEAPSPSSSARGDETDRQVAGDETAEKSGLWDRLSAAWGSVWGLRGAWQACWDAVKTPRGMAAFNIVFRLYSAGVENAEGGNTLLDGARLIARVEWLSVVSGAISWGSKELWYPAEGLQDLVVAGGGQGVYQLSFALEASAMRSGRAKVLIYRDVDLTRHRLNKEQADLRRLEAEEMARQRGLPVIWGKDRGGGPSPLFEHTLVYNSGSALHDVFGPDRGFLLLSPLVFLLGLILMLKKLDLRWQVAVGGGRKVGRWHEKNRRRRQRASPGEAIVIFDEDEEHDQALELEQDEWLLRLGSPTKSIDSLQSFE